MKIQGNVGVCIYIYMYMYAYFSIDRYREIRIYYIHWNI